MPTSLHENETIKDATFQLEEHSFRNCHLSGCNLVYDGGAFILDNTVLHDCRWKFRHAARNTFQLLLEIGAIEKDGFLPGKISELPN